MSSTPTACSSLTLQVKSESLLRGCRMSKVACLPHCAISSTIGGDGTSHTRPFHGQQGALDDLYFLLNRSIPASQAPSARPPSAGRARQELIGSPAALAVLHRHAGLLLGGNQALLARLHQLHGFPIVLNAWASWCGPCRSEFPLFATASARYGRRVAFLGVNTNDTAGDGRSFLARHPVSYPSYVSTSAQLSALAALDGLPATIFVNARGKVVYVHTGQYDTEASLSNDIERYAVAR